MLEIIEEEEAQPLAPFFALLIYQQSFVLFVSGNIRFQCSIICLSRFLCGRRSVSLLFVPYADWFQAPKFLPVSSCPYTCRAIHGPGFRKISQNFGVNVPIVRQIRIIVLHSLSEALPGFFFKEIWGRLHNENSECTLSRLQGPVSDRTLRPTLQIGSPVPQRTLDLQQGPTACESPADFLKILRDEPAMANSAHRWALRRTPIKINIRNDKGQLGSSNYF